MQLKEFWDGLVQIETTIMYGLVVSKGEGLDDGPKPKCRLIGSPTPSSPSLCEYVHYRGIIHTVCNRGGGGGAGCVENIYRSYTL